MVCVCESVEFLGLCVESLCYSQLAGRLSSGLQAVMGRRRRAVLEIREKSVWGRCEIKAVLRERAARVPAPAWGPKPARSEREACVARA